MKLLFSRIWWEKVWQMKRSSKELLIAPTTLDSFSLVNHRSEMVHQIRQTFLLYGNIHCDVCVHKHNLLIPGQ